MLKCLHCGKEYPDGATVCTMDGQILVSNTPINADKTARHLANFNSRLAKRRHWKKFIIGGYAFELFFLALCGFLPDSVPLANSFRNFGFLIHSPFMWMLQFSVSSGGFLALVAFVSASALCWGVLFHCIWRLAGWVKTRLLLSSRQKEAARLAIGLVIVIFLAWGIANALPENPTPFARSPEVSSVVNGNTAFALDLYRQLKTEPGNLFFSPYSISTALAMTSAGARNQTARETAATLHLSLPPVTLHAAFCALTDRTRQLQRWNHITLATANSLWCRQDHHFSAPFLDLIRDRYKGEAQSVDFDAARESAAFQINDWAERKTKGRIEQIISPGQISRDTSLVVCNATYFKGTWQTQFKPHDTMPMNFTISSNQTVSVPMMTQIAPFKVACSEDGNLEMLELPYSGDDLSMDVLLPNPWQASLSDIESQLSVENLRSWLAQLDHAQIHKTSVALPRFRTIQRFDLTKVLTALGMPSAFGPAADFSGMDGTHDLYLSEVIHEASIKVDEAGTEAAAVTWVRLPTKSMAGRFVADHPFIFLIRDKGSGSILFLGRVVDPTAAGND